MDHTPSSAIGQGDDRITDTNVTQNMSGSTGEESVNKHTYNVNETRPIITPSISHWPRPGLSVVTHHINTRPYPNLYRWHIDISSSASTATNRALSSPFTSIKFSEALVTRNDIRTGPVPTHTRTPVLHSKVALRARATSLAGDYLVRRDVHG